MKLVKNKKLILALILFLAVFLRLFDLAKLPSILNRDEAALAYNGYLLKETGTDEWQVKWPFVFKSFGDYKLPVYPYLLSILFHFLSPSDFAVRLPSAVAGIVLVYLAYFWAKELFAEDKKTALLFSFLIAILPIFSFYSRTAFEANLALSLFVASLYFLFKKKQQKLFSWILMFLAVLCYNTPLLLLPFIILSMPFYFDFKKSKGWLPSTIVLSIIFLLVFSKLAPLTSQKSAITIFSDPDVWENYAVYRNSFSGLWQSLLGNKYLYYLKLISENLIKSFSLKFLATSGGSHPWHSLPNWGHLFYSVYFLGILGILLSFFDIFSKKTKKQEKKKLILLLYFLLISLAPSVVTVDSPHATRSLFFFFNFSFLAVLGLKKILNFFKKENLIGFYLLIVIIEAAFYYQDYFFIYPNRQPKSLWANYKNLLKEVEDKYPNDKIIVLDDGGYQYILTAWYLKLPASDFFSTMKFQEADIINFHYGEAVSHYHFIKNEADLTNEQIILSPTEGLKEL